MKIQLGATYKLTTLGRTVGTYREMNIKECVPFAVYDNKIRIMINDSRGWRDLKLYDFLEAFEFESPAQIVPIKGYIIYNRIHFPSHGGTWEDFQGQYHLDEWYNAHRLTCLTDMFWGNDRRFCLNFLDGKQYSERFKYEAPSV